MLRPPTLPPRRRAAAAAPNRWENCSAVTELKLAWNKEFQRPALHITATLLGATTKGGSRTAHVLGMLCLGLPDWVA